MADKYNTVQCNKDGCEVGWLMIQHYKDVYEEGRLMTDKYDTVALTGLEVM